MKKVAFKNLSPISVAALAAGIALLVGWAALHEVRQSRREVLSVLEQEARSLIESIAIAGEGAIRSYGEIEDLVADRLLDSGRLLRRLDERGGLSDDLLTRVAQENSIFRIAVFDREGRPAFQSQGEEGEDLFPEGVPEEVAAHLRGQDEAVIGFIGEGLGPGRRFAVAVRRARGGAIVLSVDAAHMLDFRRSIGVGRLIQDVGENAWIDYVVLQDDEGIVSASRGITTMHSIAGDPFLEAALRGGATDSSRVTLFGGRETFEVVKPFLISEGRTGLLRVGLSMDAVRKAERRVARGVGAVIGLLTGAVAALIGLIAVRQSHALLRRAHVRLESTTGNILSGMADAVVAVDREGRITVFNRAAEQIFGYAASEAVGRPCADLIAAPTQALEETMSRGEPVTDLECHYETRRGRRLVLSVSTALLRDDEGRVDGGVAVIHDLTERKRLEEEARRRDRLTAMGELASGVAHEVRNPLNAIGVIAQRLRREFTPAEDAEGYRALVDTVRAEVARVNGIIRQFLEFARPPRLNPRQTDVAGLLEEAIRVVESRAGEKGLTIRRLFDGVGSATLDPDQIKQAILNLLTNAIEATERGEITVAASGDSHVRITVSDTGVGIPPENLSRIFDLYFTTHPEGTGLGLSLVHRIVAEHGGRIDVDSKVGRGTTFTITLPRS